MIKAGSIDKGTYLLIKGQPHLVVEREFVNPGKGSAFVRLKLKNIQSGLVIRQVSKSHESLEDIHLDTIDAQYLYKDTENYIFMNLDSFDQFNVPISGLENRRFYLLDGETYQIILWEEQPLEIKIPIKMVLEIKDAPHAERGDSVSGTAKIATTTSDLKLKVPIFIKPNDKIVVNTETGEYVERSS